MIRNTRDVSGWREKDGRRLNGTSACVDTGRHRTTQHPDGAFA